MLFGNIGCSQQSMFMDHKFPILSTKVMFLRRVSEGCCESLSHCELFYAHMYSASCLTLKISLHKFAFEVWHLCFVMGCCTSSWTVDGVD